MSNFTLFTSDQSSSTQGNSFDQDAFSDITLAPTSNSGFTDTAATNPLAGLYGNDDGVRYGAKTLYIKDLVLLSDHAKWVNGKPTYQIIWSENYPLVQGYVFGNISVNSGKYVSIRQAGDGIGLSGVARRCAFLVTGDTSVTATAQLAVDGANTTTVDFSGLSNALVDENGNALTDNKYLQYVNATSNSTKDIHDFRLTAIQTSTLRLLGVVVYTENAGANIDVFHGTTYNNKTKVTTTAGATMALPAYTGNLGGRALIYKAQNGGYSLAIQECPNIQSVATGSSGTNLMTVTTGTGGSFPLGSGIAAFFGSTGYLGNVVLQSTDTLTVSPTLPFGISGLIYKTFAGGQSLAINSSQLILSSVIDFAKSPGFTNFLAEPTGAYRVWGNGFGMSTMDTVWPSLVGTNTSLGFIQVEGLFSAADVEFVGQGVLHATFNVNGAPVFGMNAGQTGSVKKTVFTDAGPGWNSFNIGFGASYINIGINRVYLYQRALPQGYSFGLLAQMDTLPKYVANTQVNATFLSLGTYKRYFADQLYFQGGWTRGVSFTAAGGVYYQGASTNAVLNFNYYGKNFGVLGLANGSSLLVSIDGAASVGLTLGVMNTVASEGFHTIAMTAKTVSCSIYAVDVTRTQGEVKNLQNINPVSAFTSSEPESKDVYASYFISGNLTPSANVPINFDGRLFDSHNAVTTGSGWKFTAPSKGIYHVSYMLNTASASSTNPYIAINGVNYKYIGAIGAAAGAIALGGGDALVTLEKDDILDLRANVSITFTGTTQPYTCSISIHKVGE